MGAGRHALLYVYERGRAEPFRQKPQQAARETDYYSFHNADGLPDNSIEHLLGIVESDAVPVIRKISSGDTQLTWDERNKLALFIGFQEFRVPWMRRQMEGLYGKLVDFVVRGHVKVPGLLERDMERLIDEGHNLEGVSPQSLREFIERNEYAINVSPQASLTTLVQMAPVVSAYYREMEWTVIKCPDSSVFITSDNPVVKFAPESSQLVYGLGIMNPAIQIWFPLSKTASLVIRHDKDRIQKYDDLVQRGDAAKAAELRVRISGQGGHDSGIIPVSIPK